MFKKIKKEKYLKDIKNKEDVCLNDYLFNKLKCEETKIENEKKSLSSKLRTSKNTLQFEELLSASTQIQVPFDVKITGQTQDKVLDQPSIITEEAISQQSLGQPIPIVQIKDYFQNEKLQSTEINNGASSSSSSLPDVPKESNENNSQTNSDNIVVPANVESENLSDTRISVSMSPPLNPIPLSSTETTSTTVTNEPTATNESAATNEEPKEEPKQTKILQIYSRYAPLLSKFSQTSKGKFFNSITTYKERSKLSKNNIDSESFKELSDEEMVEAIKKKLISPNWVNKNGNYPIHVFLKSYIQFLDMSEIENEIERFFFITALNKPNNLQETPLIVLLKYNNKWKCLILAVLYLMYYSVEIHHVDNSGKSALDYAIEFGNLEIAKILLLFTPENKTIIPFKTQVGSIHILQHRIHQIIDLFKLHNLQECTRLFIYHEITKLGSLSRMDDIVPVKLKKQKQKEWDSLNSSKVEDTFFSEMIKTINIPNREVLKKVNIIPSHLVKYIERLGSGGCSSIHRGLYKGMDVALKLLNFSHEKDRHKDSCKELVSNVLIGDHERIVKYYGMVKLSSSYDLNTHDYYIVLQLCKFSLFDYLQINENLKKLTYKDILDYYRQMIEALFYIHSLDIVHRDIKSLNFIISFCGRLLLCDFGTTRETQEESIKNSISGDEVSTFNQLKGTISYIAPEVAQFFVHVGNDKVKRVEVDISNRSKCDIFSLANINVRQLN